MVLQGSRWFDLNNPYRYRDDNLRALGFKNYGLYLRSDLWQSIRVRVLERDPAGMCDRCIWKKATQIHHRAYDPKTLRGEDLGALTKTCGGCHLRAERLNDMSQSKYERFKAASAFMMGENHPRERAIKAAKRRRIKGPILRRVDR